MSKTRISSKFQIVIPKAVREQTGLKKGQSLQVIVKSGLITLIPERPLSSLRGIAAGINIDGMRDKKDRF